jgi:hypothetical protein
MWRPEDQWSSSLRFSTRVDAAWSSNVCSSSLFSLDRSWVHRALVPGVRFGGGVMKRVC